MEKTPSAKKIVRGYRHDVEYALRYYWATEKTPAAKKIVRGDMYQHIV